jgi:succinate-semialdehyde dehydrogenase/glutarate-semialdehyde dehydrogenase
MGVAMAAVMIGMMVLMTGALVWRAVARRHSGYQPTVIDDVGVDTLINRDETFGPIVPLVRVSGDDEALSIANDSYLGLQGAVYTRSLKRAFKYIDQLQVGNVVVNDSTDYWEAHEPFGGAAGTRTGWGRIGGRYTMLDMTDLRTVVLDAGSVE